MYKKLQYDPILANPADWPVVRMNQAQDTFLQAVSDKAVKDILALQPNTAALRTELAKSLLQEQIRLQKMSWRVDAKEDPAFWSQIIHKLQEGDTPLVGLLHQITLHYAQEIAGGFNMWHYKLAQATACYTLNRLLNPVKAGRPRSLTHIRAQLLEQIHMMGAINDLRQLARKGTIVMVPTHCSHFDSVLIWWVIRALGLPPFIYGAGRNLFNKQFFAYFMNKLGTYKVDRRKKNIAYLNTLKGYSSLALHWGCHSLFYPGGTRSRTGALEETLKLGLLGTALEAQQINYEVYGPQAPKLFIVPVVFNYHFVLEAPFLIRDYLVTQEGYTYKPQKDWLNNSYKLLKLIKNFATKSSSISVSIGQPMDVIGNTVDAAGNSYDTQGNQVTLYNYLSEPPDTADLGQRFKEYTRELGQRILRTYRINNCVLSSSLVAFTAFELLRKSYATLPLKDFLNLPSSTLTLSYRKLENSCIQVREGVLALAAQGEIRISQELTQGTIADMITHGLSNLGIYHHQLPLLRNEEGDVTARDICSLLYYHNRLTGYGLEKYIE